MRQKTGRRTKAHVTEEWALAPQTERPRHALGLDTSVAPKSRVQDMTWAQFDKHIQALARKISSTKKVDAVVGVAFGGVFVGGALAKALGVDFFPVRISRRSRDSKSRALPKMSGQMPKELAGKRVVIADDVAASGDTLELAQKKLLSLPKTKAWTVSLLARPEGYQPDFFCQKTDDFVVFPWDYDASSDMRF